MAQELFLGIKLGISGAAAIGAALGSAHNAMARLGETARRLTSEQQRLGDAIRRHMGQLAPSTLAALHRDYERLGQTIDAVRIRQEKLGHAMARREALREERARLSGELMGAYGTALAVGAPVFGAVREAAAFGDAVKEIAIVGELTAAEEKRLGASLAAVALAVNQTAEDMARGVGLLIANGMEAKAAAQQAELLGRFTTATRASFDDAARMMVSFSQLGVSADQMALAFSQAAKAGKLGSFEVRDMARWFPQLGGYIKALGITGNEAVINMASRLQVAMKTAGSTDEAANNFRNFLAKLTSPDTVKDFDRLGIDMQGSMLRLARQGLDPIEGAVGIIMQQIGQRAPQVTQELEALSREIAAIKDPTERAAELTRRRAMIEALGQRAGLGQMFQDMQAVGYLLAEIQNRDALKRIRAEVATGKTSSGQMSLDADFARRMESPIEQFKAMKIALSDMAMAVGDALLPALTDIVRTVKPVVLGFADLAKTHPALIKGALGFAVGMAGVKAAVLSAGWAINFLVKSPLAALATGWQSLAARLLLGRAAMLAGAGPLKTLLLVAGLSEAGIARLGAGLAKFRALAVTALTHVGRAVLWLGRAVLMNPIGLTLAAIAGAAYLVWRNWGAIGPKLASVWQHIKTGFASAWDWLKELPGKMMAIGREIVAGLIDGIKSRLAAAGQAIADLGETLKSKFKGWLGIRSPSRVFADFGQMIGLGAAQGITGMSGTVARASAGLATAATLAFSAQLAAAVPAFDATRIAMPQPAEALRTIRQTVEPVALPKPAEALRTIRQTVEPVALPKPAEALRTKAGQQAMPQQTSITFAPVIYITASGDKAAVSDAVQEGMRLSFAEFERLMRRYDAERRRVSPMGGLL